MQKNIAEISTSHSKGGRNFSTDFPRNRALASQADKSFTDAQVNVSKARTQPHGQVQGRNAWRNPCETLIRRFCVYLRLSVRQRRAEPNSDRFLTKRFIRLELPLGAANRSKTVHFSLTSCRVQNGGSENISGPFPTYPNCQFGDSDTMHLVTCHWLSEQIQGKCDDLGQ